MYLSFYQLDRKPFQISTDPKFLWLGDKHKEALAVLRYALMDNKGFLLLTGDAGTGKTTLINALVNTLGEEIIAATLLDPGIEKDDFFSYIGKAFQLEQAFSSKGEFVYNFTNFLNQAHEERKKILLIIDESQRLSQELLEEIRLLSNIEKQYSKLINIFFVGQIEFNSIILEPQNSALRQRISVNYNLTPLSAKETGQYIHHRLKVAGAAKSLFNAAAVKEVFQFSKGYPRLTNIICDRALVTGFISESKKIGPKIIKECAQELKLQSQKSRPKMEKRQGKAIPATSQKTSTFISGRPFIEKILYTILAVLITVWVAIAVNYYYPQYFPFKRSQKPEVANTSPLAVDSNPIESREQTKIQEQNQSSNATQKKVSETPASEKKRAAKSDPKDSTQQFQMPDPHTVIRIEFDGSTELGPDGIDTLDNLSMVLHNHPHLEIIIKGYSKGQGSYRYNKKMSEFTANIVKGYLVGKGISSQRVEALGMWVIHSDSEVPAPQTSKSTQWVEIQFKNP
ncbi:MAG: AAA family ATPase [Deltaproteobacteria bacterium]|nr:AAA family ATPase [Deltaproteobacteria bacterium]